CNRSSGRRNTLRSELQGWSDKRIPPTAARRQVPLPRTIRSAAQPQTGRDAIETLQSLRRGKASMLQLDATQIYYQFDQTSSQIGYRVGPTYRTYPLGKFLNLFG